MDITITTCDPDVVAEKLDAIRAAVEDLNLFVDRITIIPRGDA
jgi:hypothetical protein